jgi:hypothetical protein
MDEMVKRRVDATLLSGERVAFIAYRGWSLYGAPWLQPVASGRKWHRRETGENKPKPLPCVATGCREDAMVRVHPL